VPLGSTKNTKIFDKVPSCRSLSSERNQIYNSVMFAANYLALPVIKRFVRHLG